MLEVKNLHATIAGKEILKGIDLTIRDGETHAIMGVSMVKMALDKLNNEGVMTLDDDKKAAMVSNLLVVLCSDDEIGRASCRERV